jgi:hypothetical protein
MDRGILLSLSITTGRDIGARAGHLLPTGQQHETVPVPPRPQKRRHELRDNALRRQPQKSFDIQNEGHQVTVQGSHLFPNRSHRFEPMTHRFRKRALGNDAAHHLAPHGRRRAGRVPLAFPGASYFEWVPVRPVFEAGP